jgi:hypothetical protein
MFNFFDKFGGLIIFLIFFSSCAACVIAEDSDKQFCKPICAPFVAEYKNADGQCVCNMNMLIRKD